MRIPDANVLLYATDSKSARHSRAREWLERSLSESETVGLALVALLAFIRISTNPRLFTAPLSVTTAFDQVDEWLAQPPAAFLQPGRRHLAIWRDLAESSGTGGNLTTDAHLAALAVERGATLASFDGDFHRFGGLELEYLR